jgi:hypothetical protein
MADENNGILLKKQLHWNQQKSSPYDIFLCLLIISSINPVHRIYGTLTDFYIVQKQMNLCPIEKTAASPRPCLLNSVGIIVPYEMVNHMTNQYK